MFSEELKDPQPSDFSFSEAGMSIISVSQVDKYTYKLLTNKNPTQSGTLTLYFGGLKDYNGNKITNGSTSFLINLSIPVDTTATRNGVSTGGYPSISVSWFFTMVAQPLPGNTLYRVKLTTGSTDCNAGSLVTPVTSDATVGVTALNSGTTYNFSVDTSVIISQGAQVILVCVDNDANNKHGTGVINIVRDDSAPTFLMASPVAGNYIVPQTMTFNCGDNGDRIAYDFASNVFSGTDPLLTAITDPAFNPVTGAITSGTLYDPNAKPTNPYGGNTTRTIYKYRCIDRAGNISAVASTGVYRVNDTFPTVSIGSVTKTGVSPAVSIVGISNNVTPGHPSATLTWSTNQVGQAWEIRTGATDCGVGGTVVAFGSGGTATPSPANTPITTVLTPASPGLAIGGHQLRVCVTNGTDWGQGAFNLLRDDTQPSVPTVNVPAGNYGATQYLVFSCTDNADRLIYTESTSTPTGTPSDPGDPQFDANGLLSFGAPHSGPVAVTTDSTATVGKKTLVKWRCIDYAGNVSAVSNATYTIDTLLPSVTVQSQDRTSVSTVAGAYNATQITWSANRDVVGYSIRRGSTNCSDGTVLSSGTNLSSASILAGGTLVTSTINANAANFPGGDGDYTIHICTTNHSGGKGYTTAPLKLDSVVPQIAPGSVNATLNSSDGINFTLTWSGTTDNVGVAGYRIFRSLTTNTYGSTPDYVATSSPATIAMPDTQKYFLRIVPFDAAGNVPGTAPLYYSELATKPEIRLVVSGLSGAFDITDGVASLNVPANIVAPGNIWSTSLVSGQTYNFSITAQPAGQVCAIKEKQFGIYNTDLTINVNCVNGYQVGGQNLNTVPSVKLGYRLFQGRNIAIAGSGTPGGTDAAGASASFNFPEYLTHLNGNLYVSDTNTFKIRRIALTGNVVTSLTGTGSNGTGTIADDGLCGSAALGQPMGITTDGTNIYVAEINYGRIRKISDINGTCRVMTLVGTGVSGYAEGAANVAQFNQPRQIVANNNHIYVADSINNRIRRISLSTGVVDTLIGNGAATDANGTGTAASISAPIGLALINTMLYASTAQHRIMSIDINSQVATIVAGDGTASYTDASGLTARFNQIYSMTTDGVDLYTAEIANHVIRRVDVANNFRVTTLAGLPAVAGDVTNANGVAARFNLPHGIATDGRSLFIANHTGHTIRKLIDNGLVAYWPLNGSLADHSSAGSFNKAGTITGTVAATTGRFGEANGAYYFDGAQSSIGTPGGTQADTNFNTGNFTVAFWVKPALTQQETSVNKDYDIISNWGTQYDFAIRYHNEVSSGVTIPPNIPGQMIFIRFDGTTSAYCTSGIRIDDSKFHHIAAQKSGGTLSMYIDGKKVCVASDTVGSITSVGPPRIGARDGGISNDFTGALADMRIYARALNEGEINELAQDAGGTAEVGNGYSTAGTGLLAHYQFNGATATPSGPLGGNLSGGASLYAGKDGDASGALYYDTVPASFLTGADYGLPVANAPRSLCGWFYPMSHPSTGHTNILSYGNSGAATNGQGLAIEVDSGKVKVSYHFGGGQSRFADWTPPLNTWTHFCGTYDGSTILMYVNGVALPQTGSTFTPPLTTTTVGATGLGIGVWGGASKFNGKLDDLRIYNNALSAIAVRQLATQVPIGLVARYDFSGDTKDVSGFGNDLTNGGANSSSDRFGISGGAYHFNGTSNVMSNTSTALPFPVNTANRTMCFWGRADQALGGVRIGVAYGNSSTNQAAQIGVNNLDTTGPSTLGCAYGAPCSPGGFIAQNTWYNICMVVSGSNAQIYLNGGAAGSAVSAAAWTTTRGPISIGSYSSNYWFPGDIDEVLIYNRALSANEIRTLTGHRPQQVSGWSVNNAATSLKFHLQPESATYANGSCFGGANCVSAWRDTSGLNNHLAQAAVSNRPVYDAVGINFRPALRFVDTASTFVTGTCSGDLNSQAMTVLAVLKEVSQGGNDGIFQNGGPGNGKLIYLLDSPARPALFDLQANQLNFQPTGATAYNASSESVLMSFDYVFTNPSASGNFYKNGASVASAVSTPTGSYNCGAGTLDMGRYFWGAGGDYYDGYMGDFLYFNGVLSNADRQVAECYLSAKYNVSVGANCP